jgi:hypothetical protein
MLPCGNCALRDAENTNLKNALFINTLIHNYSLTDVIKNVIEEEVSKEIKKVVDTTTEEHLCKLKTCIALKDARIEHLVQTDTEKDLERAKKDLEREVRDSKLDKYIEILIQSNKEKDTEREKKDLEREARDEKLGKHMEFPIQSNTDKESEISKLNEKTDETLKRINAVEKELADVNARHYDLVHTLSAREIGASADRVALNRIFPKFMRKKSGIETLAQLKQFFDSYNTNTISKANTCWLNLSSTNQKGIKRRYDAMLIKFPGLIDHIKNLKDQFYYAHRISSDGKTEYKYFSVIGNKLITEGIDCCLPLVPKAELNSKYR